MDIAETLNHYFPEIGHNLSNKMRSTEYFSHYIKPVKSTFYFMAIYVENVYQALKKRKTRKVAGPDNMSARLLKDSVNVTLPFLTRIFTLSLSEGVFPDHWKNARVSPVYKSESKDECGNYRPTSVLSVVSKLFEKLFKQIYFYYRTILREV